MEASLIWQMNEGPPADICRLLTDHGLVNHVPGEVRQHGHTAGEVRAPEAVGA